MSREFIEMFRVFHPVTNARFSSQRVGELESDIIVSLLACTTGSNPTNNYPGSSADWLVAINMHTHLWFSGDNSDDGWVLPYTWRSIPIRPFRTDMTFYVRELQSLNFKYVAYIETQGYIVDGLSKDLDTLRMISELGDTLSPEQVEEARSKLFYTGKESDLIDAFRMQGVILAVLEENLDKVKAWIADLARQAV